MSAEGGLDAQVKALREAFVKFDEDNDGLISVDQLHSVVQVIEPDVDNTVMKQIINDANVNGTGRVDFRSVLLALARSGGEEIWEAVFKMFDTDGDGYITQTEYQQIMTDLYGGQAPIETEIDEIFLNADTDRDGRISYDEFIKNIINRG